MTYRSFLFATLFLFLSFVSQGYSQSLPESSMNFKPVVTSGGKKVWPPHGPGCDHFVRCCNVAEKLDSSVSLMCQLTVSITPLDCVKGLADFKQYLTEIKTAVPKECE